MKYSTIAVTVAALVAGVVGQSILDLPECPRNCIFSGSAKTECSLIDVACSCRDLSYQQQLAGCMATCDPADAAKGAEVGAAICKQAGVTISIPSITTTVSTPPATEPAPTTVPTTTTPAVTTTDTPTPTPTPTTPVDDGEDDEETTTSTTVPPIATMIPTTLVSVKPPVPTGNVTTNGTVTPPVTTPTPPPQDSDSGAGRIAFGSMLGAAVVGAVAFAL